MGGQINTLMNRLASRRKGLVERDQLLDAGISERQIDRRLGNGSLIPEYDGVYRVGHRAPSLECSYLAAVLACGEGALLSGRAAAYLYGLIKGDAPPPEVTTPTQRQPDGVIRHRTRGTDRRDVARHRGIPITTVPRTVVDMAADSTPEVLAAIVHEARVRFGVKPEHVEAVLKRRRTAPGAAKLRRVMRGDERVLLSQLERGFIALLRKHNLPLPKTNIPRDGHWVDCRWPEYNLTVELDTYRYHSTRRAWERDQKRERKARARRDDYRRYVWGDVFETPDELVAELTPALTAPTADRPG
jgi:hypothetical protein